MAAVSRNAAVTLLLLLGIITVAVEAQISCNTVANSLTPCINFVMGGNAPTTGCCSGIRSLFGAAQTTAARRGVCTCLKDVASSATADQIARAASLPGKCGVSIPYKISPQIDCSTVN